MNRLMDLHKRAVAKLGAENISSICNVFGAWDGGLGTVPQSRHDDLAAALGRMLGSNAAIARAQADFKTIDEARREPSKPQTLDAAAIYAKWNAPK